MDGEEKTVNKKIANFGLTKEGIVPILSCHFQTKETLQCFEVDNA